MSERDDNDQTRDFERVLRENRAVDLYERLGFEEYGQTATHRLMRIKQE